MQDIFQDIKQQVNISDVCSLYGINPAKHSGNRFTSICPLHNEKSPSLTVYTDTNSFYCYGCGSGGDAIALVERLFNLSPKEAAIKLSEDFNISLNLSKTKEPKSGNTGKSELNKLIIERRNNKMILSILKEWENHYILKVCTDIKAYNNLLELCKPKSPDDEVSSAYASAINRVQILEYHFRILLDGNIQDKLLLYKEITKGGLKWQEKQIKK